MQQLARPYEQHTYAVGEDVYAVTQNGALWRIRGDAYQRLPPASSSRRQPKRVQAGADVLVVGAQREASLELVRIRGSKRDRVRSSEIASWLYAVDNLGRLVFIRNGHVMQLNRDATKPRRLVSAADVDALWRCGPDICTASKTTQQLVVHKRPYTSKGHTTEVFADVGTFHHGPSCNADVVAWETGERGPSGLRVVWLEDSP